MRLADCSHTSRNTRIATSGTATVRHTSAGVSFRNHCGRSSRVVAAGAVGVDSTGCCEVVSTDVLPINATTGSCLRAALAISCPPSGCP